MPPVISLNITIKKMLSIEIGSKTVQENFSKSKDAILGNVARIQIITKIIKNDFRRSQKACSKYIIMFARFVSKTIGLKYFPNGDRYPPKNKTANSKEFANSIEYSLK